MKNHNLVFFLFLILFSCSDEPENTSVTQKQTSRSEKPASELEAPNTSAVSESTDSVFSQNSGILEWLNPGKGIRKGAVLYRIDNSKSFELIYREKKKCKQLIDSLIQTCPDDLATVLPKWQLFSKNLKLDSLTPAFPKIAFREEAAHFGNSNFVATYNDLLKKERKMKSNFHLSKRDYAAIDWLTKRGAKVKKGQLIGIAKHKN
jgi:hypothetical protein